MTATTNTTTTTKTYDDLQQIVERHGGSMWHETEGYTYGAWLVQFGNGPTIAFESNGTGYPEIDNLYVRNAVYPKTSDDYTNALVADAEAIFLKIAGWTPTT